MTSLARRFVLVLSVLILGAGARGSSERSVAFRTQGTGIYSPFTGDYGGPGVGTHLGRHSFTGNVATSPTSNPFVFNFFSTAPQETIAADGDTLYFSASGHVELIPLDEAFTSFMAIWEGDFQVVGGTGRFAGARPADRPLHVVAVNDPFTFLDEEWTFSWELSGRIVSR